MNEQKFINDNFPESKGRIDDKCKLTWNQIIALLENYNEQNSNQKKDK